MATIVAEHGNGFARFGIECVDVTLSAQERKLVFVEDTELDDDLVRDMTEILTSFCARLYGRRAVKNKAAAVRSALEAA